ncbi:hypothetical protein EC973_004082 [Apophysomyces ossiformis]|uniref:Uncharacterized protein n=1 Tax=Apophysomyces ossiformis TaxID=679940 RepID=A0A8H7EQ58_9FUNG|nr:hypothetical protein EC973_004082 [Apophysomyces ossiformis]
MPDIVELDQRSLSHRNGSKDDILPPYEETDSSIYANHARYKNDKFTDIIRLAILPLINIVCSVVLIGAVIYVFTSSDNQSLEKTIAGMRVPTFLALLMTILKMFLSGGIGYAVSEYKWVRLQNTEGTKLSLLEMYDACTRGVGGIFRVFALLLRFDTVLIPAIIFQFGFIAIGPASQQILTSSAYQQYSCTNNETAMLYNDIDYLDMVALRSNRYDMRFVKGLQFDFLGTMAMQQAGHNLPAPIMLSCPGTATNCTYPHVDMFRTDVECQQGNFDTPVLNHHTMKVEPIRRLLRFNDSNPLASLSAPQLPLVLYGPSMLGRTWWDLNNLTTPTSQPNLNNNTTRSIRSYLGEQTFIAATYKGGTNSRSADPKTTVITQCTLRSYRNSTTVIATNNSLIIQTNDFAPINIDLDQLANPAILRNQKYGAQQLVMHNAYGVQLTAMNTLIVHNPELMRSNAAKSTQRSSDQSFQGFLTRYLHQLDQLVSLLLPMDPDFLFSRDGQQCTVAAVRYHANPLSYYFLSLSLVIPLIWWIIVWSIGLYKTNGISRGTSQIALLVTGFTDLARERFKGLSHAGQNELLNKANKINIVFGETRGGMEQMGHVAFGLKEEQLRPIRARRSSTDHT